MHQNSSRIYEITQPFPLLASLHKGAEFFRKNQPAVGGKIREARGRPAVIIFHEDVKAPLEAAELAGIIDRHASTRSLGAARSVLP